MVTPRLIPFSPYHAARALHTVELHCGITITNFCNEVPNSYVQLQEKSNLQKAVALSREKGASTWLTALPLTDSNMASRFTSLHSMMLLRFGMAGSLPVYPPNVDGHLVLVASKLAFSPIRAF